MAGRYNTEDFKNPFSSTLIKDGFVNDITPLDDYNLNLMITAMTVNHQGIEDIKDENKLRDVTIGEHKKELDTYTAKLGKLEELINKCDDLDVVDVEPQVTVTTRATKKDTNTSVTSVERGTEITFTANLSFKDGEYKYGAVDSSDNPISDEVNCFECLTNSSSGDVGYQVIAPGGSLVTPTGFTNSPLTTSIKCDTEGTYTLQIDANLINKDSITPLTKLGKNLEDYDYLEHLTSKAQVTCYMPAGFIVTDSIHKSPAITSNYLRQDSNMITTAYRSGASHTKTISSGTVCVLIAVPSNKSKPQIVDQRSYQDISSSFDRYGSNVTVEDSAGTNYSTSYTIYRYAPPNGWTTGTTIKVTLA